MRVYASEVTVVKEEEEEEEEDGEGGTVSACKEFKCTYATRPCCVCYVMSHRDARAGWCHVGRLSTDSILMTPTSVCIARIF